MYLYPFQGDYIKNVCEQDILSKIRLKSPKDVLSGCKIANIIL